MIQTNKIIAITNIESAPIKRLIQYAKEKNKCIDITCGRKARAVIFTVEDNIILSSLQPATITKKANNNIDGLENIDINS